jgi:hypothetical protein
MILDVEMFQASVMLRVVGDRFRGLIVGIDQSWFIDLAKVKCIE